MRKLFTLFFSFLLFYNLLISQSYPAYLTDVCEIACEESIHLPGPPTNKSLVPDNYDIYYHRMDWTVDPAVSFIAGKITTLLYPTFPNITDLVFDCASNLQVDSVRVNGNIAAYTQNGDALEIALLQPLPLSVSAQVEVWYQGNPQNNGLGSFIASVHGTNNDPVIWTLSEPYGAKEWWPCKQSLNDKIDSIDIYISAPSAYKAAANGVLKSETTIGQQTITHWQHKYPIPAYLIAIGITNYLVYTEYAPIGVNDSIIVLNYVYPEDEVNARIGTAPVKDFMALFNQKFGDYPYPGEKYGHAQFGFGGGMEHTTMSFMGNWSFDVVSHELAHQWFGNLITCRYWRDIWLNEGFATYLNGLAYEAIFPNLYWPIWKEQKRGHVISDPGGALRVDDTTNINRIFDARLSYSKGGMVLHMLRWVLGDQDFFQGVTNYLQDPALRYGYAETSDLKFHLEQASGKNLTYFFNDWYTGEGHPMYKITWGQSNNGLIHLQLLQSTSHPSVNFFKLPVPIGFYGGGQDTVIVFNHQSNAQYFFQQLPFQVDSIVFDPDIWLIAEVDTILLGIPTADQTAGISLFPNPVTDQLYLDMPEGNKEIMARIMDLSGRIVRSDLVISPGAQTTWNVQFLSPGLYYILAQTEEKPIKIPFIKL